MKTKKLKMHKLFFIFLFFTCSNGSQPEPTKNLGEKMQKFIIDLSDYAKSQSPNFIIIPQNGIELAFKSLDPSKELNTKYLNSIDGFGVEELFFNGTHQPDNYRLEMLRKLKDEKKIMVSEYITHNDSISSVITKNHQEGFLCFPRDSANYNYTEIPFPILNSNPNIISNLSEAQNYLYLINPEKFSDKTEMIDSIAQTNYDLILIDLFVFGEELLASDIEELKTKPNGAKRLVIAYINIGAVETYRYYWQDDWKLGSPSWIVKEYEGYPNEYYINFWNKQWRDIIYGNDTSYIKKIIDAHFDGAYLDNTEVYYFLNN